MIRKLRNRHRLAVIAMWILLPLLLAAAILNREEIPRQEILPTVDDRPLGEPVFDGQLAGDDLFFHAHIYHGQSGDLLTLQAEQSISAPDILVYWLGSGKNREEGLLLGTLAPGSAAIDLPHAARSGGLLELYSLGWQRSLGNLVLPVTGEVIP